MLKQYFVKIKSDFLQSVSPIWASLIPDNVSQTIKWKLKYPLSTSSGFSRTRCGAHNLGREALSRRKNFLFWILKLMSFQRSVFLRMRRLVLWLKRFINWRIKCIGTAIYMKTKCLQTNETQNCYGKESALRAGGGVERLALIKSLIYAGKKEHA